MGPVRSFRCPHRPRRLTRNEPAETALFRRRTTSSPDTRTEVHPLPGFSLLPRRASAATSPVEMFPAETQRRFRPAGTPPSSPASAPSCRDSPPPGFLRGSSSCARPPAPAFAARWHAQNFSKKKRKRHFCRPARTNTAPDGKKAASLRTDCSEKASPEHTRLVTDEASPAILVPTSGETAHKSMSFST